jgi:hypothetical protein
MTFTPKQVRQGTDIGADGHNSAVANEGPMPDVAPLIGQAMGAAAAYSDNGLKVFEGGGVTGTVSFEWDDGLAIPEQPGEA